MDSAPAASNLGLGDEVSEDKEPIRLTDQQRLDWLRLIRSLFGGVPARDYSVPSPKRSASLTKAPRSLTSVIAPNALRSLAA